MTTKQVKTTQIEVNPDAITPDNYFKILKSKLKKTKKESLEKQLATIAQQIIMAKEVGQKNFLHKLSFTYNVLVKEQELLANGYSKFVYKDDVKTFIEKVEPKNSIKIIELERFPRAIPPEELKKIQAAKELGIFDDFCVVFTDFTDQSYESKEDKAFVARNRDPVVFGYFKHDGTGLRHDRFYLVADWKDEYCELDFSAMINKMGRQGIKNPEHTISTDDKYLRELVAGVMTEMDEQANRDRFVRLPTQTSPHFWDRLKKFFGK